MRESQVRLRWSRWRTALDTETRTNPASRRNPPRRGLGGLALALVVAAGSVWSQPASAAVDLNGLWRVGVFATQFSLTFTDVCSLTIVQTGTTLSITGPCEGMANPVTVTGSIDPATGAFTGSGSAGVCPAIAIDGSGVRDSKWFSGRFSCPEFQATGGVNGSRCGNGQIDPGEACDDGNTLNGDCCTAGCQLESEGEPCGDDGPCVSNTCNAAGQCQRVVLTGPCDDGNCCTARVAVIAAGVVWRQCIGAVALVEHRHPGREAASAPPGAGVNVRLRACPAPA